MTPYVRLPALSGMAPPDYCPWCRAPRTDDPAFFDDVLGIENPRGVVAYTCGSGYGPDRGDVNDDPGLGVLDYHPAPLHPLRLLAIFCSFYRDRLGALDVADLASFDRSGRITDWTSGNVPAFAWLRHPFRLTLPILTQPPPLACPHCGERRLGAKPVVVAMREYQTLSGVYGCGADYEVHGVKHGHPVLWSSATPCYTPRPLAILAAPGYWNWEQEPWVAEARDFVMGAWTRNALTPNI